MLYAVICIIMLWSECLATEKNNDECLAHLVKGYSQGDQELLAASWREQKFHERGLTESSTWRRYHEWIDDTMNTHDQVRIIQTLGRVGPNDWDTFQIYCSQFYSENMHGADKAKIMEAISWLRDLHVKEKGHNFFFHICQKFLRRLFHFDQQYFEQPRNNYESLGFIARDASLSGRDFALCRAQQQKMIGQDVAHIIQSVARVCSAQLPYEAQQECFANCLNSTSSRKWTDIVIITTRFYVAKTEDTTLHRALFDELASLPTTEREKTLDIQHKLSTLHDQLPQKYYDQSSFLEYMRELTRVTPHEMPYTNGRTLEALLYAYVNDIPYNNLDDFRFMYNALFVRTPFTLESEPLRMNGDDAAQLIACLAPLFTKIDPDQREEFYKEAWALHKHLEPTHLLFYLSQLCIVYCHIPDAEQRSSFHQNSYFQKFYNGMSSLETWHILAIIAKLTPTFEIMSLEAKNSLFQEWQHNSEHQHPLQKADTLYQLTRSFQHMQSAAALL